MAVKKSGLGKGLGRGLDALIPENTNYNKNEEDNNHNIKTKLKISEVEPNRDQPRKSFDEDSLDELADSIKEFGILQPLLVQKENNYYKIIAGERRWRAAKKAGLKEVPVIIRDYTKQQVLEISLIENIQRENLNPIEEAIAYKQLMDEFKLKQEEIAERVSKSRTAITNAMRLLKLDKRVQEMLIEDIISNGHARALLPIEDPELQYNLAVRVFDEKLSVRETEKLIKDILNPKEIIIKELPKEGENLVYRELEEKIKSIMGTKVSINQKSKDKGKIEIEYYSDEELERIIELFEGIR